MNDRIIDNLIKRLQSIKRAGHDLDPERHYVSDAIEEISELLEDRLKIDK